MRLTKAPVLMFAPAPADAGSAYKVTLPRVIRSEWIKFRSVRATILAIGLTGLAVVIIGVLVAMLSGGSIGAGDEVVYDPVGNSLFGVMIDQLVLGMLGAVLVTSEYSTGQIRSTLTAVPKRLPVLWAKVIVVAGVTFGMMIATVSVAFFAGQALYRGVGTAASLSDPGVPRALLGAAVAPTAIAVMGVAFGALMRQTATAVGILFGLLFIAPLFLQLLGGVWGDVGTYLPSEAGQAMMNTLVDDPEQMSPLAGLAVMFGWVSVLLTGAAIMLKRRDA